MTTHTDNPKEFSMVCPNCRAKMVYNIHYHGAECPKCGFRQRIDMPFAWIRMDGEFGGFVDLRTPEQKKIEELEARVAELERRFNVFMDGINELCDNAGH